MNEIIQHKSWIKLNRKWFIPFVGLFIIGSVVLFKAGLGGKINDISKAYADTALYENAIKEVEKNITTINALGEIQPIDKIAITEGFVNYSDYNKKVKTTIRIKGTKEHGKLEIF